jgi:MoxR-like ATPase
VLLVRGPPGTGKSTLARNVANALGWDYLETVVTSRTQSRDLLWTFDAMDRLNDAYANAVDRSDRVRDKKNYLEPGPLFRAFDPELANELRPVTGPVSSAGAVVLIDEIDKADPDLPNDLLVPLEAKRFFVEALGREVQATREVFVIVSTNEERDLPQAFLRRCVVTALARPTDREVLLKIAESHFSALDADLFQAVFDLYASLGSEAEAENLRAPGTAEFLDTLRVCETLGIKDSKDTEFKLAARAALWKHGE